MSFFLCGLDFDFANINEKLCICSAIMKRQFLFYFAEDNSANNVVNSSVYLYISTYIPTRERANERFIAVFQLGILGIG